MNYTKGEWEVKKFGDAYAIRINDNCRIRYLCSLPLNEEDLANAHLIAAAPEMYEALKALTFQFAIAVEQPYSTDRRVYDQANKALAKAEGKS